MLSETLIRIRQSMGYQSARSFYGYLSEHGSLEFNYSYYVRIEGGKVLPSTKVIHTIANILQKRDSEELVMEYCQELFPNQKYLFKQALDRGGQKEELESASQAIPRMEGEEVIESGKRQKVLTERQISSITRSKLHYYLFLILTLARDSVSVQQLENYFPKRTLDKIFKDLETSKMIRVKDSQVFSLASELKFPKPDTRSIQKHYEKLDQWDQEFDGEFHFEKLARKMFIRRVSPRYIQLIINHCELLFDLIRSSEEINTDYNDDVLMFSLNVTKGRLPG